MKKLLAFVVTFALGLVPLTSYAAVSATHILTQASASTLSSYGTNSGSPTTNNLQLLCVGNQVSSGTANAPTVTGDGLTWVQVDTKLSSDNLRRATLFRALGTASAGALTIDMAAQTQVRAGWSWSEFGGIDTTGTNGSGAIVQSGIAETTTGAASTGLLITLSSFGSVNNAAYGCIRYGTLTGGTLTVGSGFTELGNALSNTRYESEYQLSNDNTVDWSYPSESIFTEGVAVEIKVAASVTLSSGTQMMLGTAF